MRKTKLISSQEMNTQNELLSILLQVLFAIQLCRVTFTRDTKHCKKIYQKQVKITRVFSQKIYDLPRRKAYENTEKCLANNKKSLRFLYERGEKHTKTWKTKKNIGIIHMKNNPSYRFNARLVKEANNYQTVNTQMQKHTAKSWPQYRIEHRKFSIRFQKLFYSQNM